MDKIIDSFICNKTNVSNFQWLFELVLELSYEGNQPIFEGNFLFYLWTDSADEICTAYAKLNFQIFLFLWEFFDFLKYF